MLISKRCELEVHDLFILKIIGCSFLNYVSLNEDRIADTPKYEKFDNIQINDLRNLRWNLYKRSNSCDEYFNKMLRYVELNLVKIDLLLKSKYKSKSEKHLFINLLICSFLEFNFYHGDFRFLNATLKIIDSCKYVSLNSYTKKLTLHLLNRVEQNR